MLKNRNVKDCSENWNEDADVAEGLKQFFASEDDLETFLETLNKVLRQFHQLVDDETVIYLERGLFGAPMWIRLRYGFGLGLLIGGLEWILVDLTPGAPDLYPIRTAAEEE